MITTNTNALSGKPRVIHINRLIRIIKGRLKGGILLLSNEESETVSFETDNKDSLPVFILQINNSPIYISVSWTAPGIALLSTEIYQDIDGIKSAPKG